LKDLTPLTYAAYVILVPKIHFQWLVVEEDPK